MGKVLTYVDPILTYQVATGVIGSEVRLSQRDSAAMGINFKILLSQSRGTERATTTKVSELLPEVVADAVYDAVTDKIDSLDHARNRLIAGGVNAYRPGTPVIVKNGQLSLEGKNRDAQLSGEECAQYRLRLGDFYFHAYCAKATELILDSLVSQPIEVLGLLRYTPSYSVPGAISLSLGIRVCAIWLR